MVDSTHTPTETRPNYEVLAAEVKALGVETVFGLMSDDTADFAATLDAMGVRFIGARHENNAIAMAEGYHSASGRLGIAVIGRGPATANGLHGAVYAQRSGSSVLIIYGEAAIGTPANPAVGPDYKAFNALGVLGAAGLETFRATSADTARTTLVDAAKAAMKGRTVALLLPVDVQLAQVVPSDFSPASTFPEPAPAPAAAPPAAIESAVRVLGHSRRPLIIAGVGAYRAGAKEALERLAERVGALCATTARGKDLFRGSPHALGVIGSFSHSMGRRYIEQADCVVVFGASLNLFTTSFGTAVPKVPLIQVDAVRSHIGRYRDADVSVLGDARVVAEQLLDALPERAPADKPFHASEVHEQIAQFDITTDFQPANTARTLDPRTCGVALDQVLPSDRSLVYDGGNFVGVVPYLEVPGPDRFKFTTDFASIGMGFGTALGVAAARPDSTTVLVIGDGGFMMTLNELETAAREDLRIVIVVMNDCAYGAEVHFLRMRQLPDHKAVFPDVDLGPIAEGFGFETATIRTLADLEAAAPLLRDPQGPVLIDCKINAEVAAPVMAEFAEFERANH